MSRVLAQARAKYKKSIFIEFFIGLVSSSVIALLSNAQSAVDFCLGFSSAFIPFCIFVYVVFYRKQDLSKKLTALYRGEAIKFILTILIIVISFKWLSVTYFIVFFTGFFAALMLNNIIPFLLNRS
ncbi:ATP synthase subunit I [Aggregatibacter kilianii]|uniref:ATP synthase subunit I n=1 Tax=Aggregatibacter kilianii TaxID=2025884 RepID=UPI000D641907|nr:ATP synthase subunit I [Aggregatibacter kilianii]